MIIRKATSADTIHIIRSLQNKKIHYNTPAHAKEDVNNDCLYILEHENKIIAQCALIYDAERKYYAMKRLCVYNKKNLGKGIAQMFISYFEHLGVPALGVTPWEENKAMIHILEKNGFIYQYTFLENYLFYYKKVLTNQASSVII